MIKNFFKKITGIDRIEQITAEAEAKMKEAVEKAAEHQREAARAQAEAEAAKLSPKELADKNGEPYVAVLDTKVNPDNPRNGFFELDWNEHFIVQLKNSGYSGESDEAIVDQWFQDLCRNVGAEAGVNMDRRGSGYININSLGDGRSEVS
jgi:hypothetical protein